MQRQSWALPTMRAASGLQITSRERHVFVSRPAWSQKRSRFRVLVSGNLYFDKRDGHDPYTSQLQVGLGSM